MAHARRRRCIFGQYKVEHTLLGLTLCLAAWCGIALSWFGPWGNLLWFPLLLVGMFPICIPGHCLLFLLILRPPVRLASMIVERSRNRR